MNAKQRRKQHRWRRGRGTYFGPWWIPYDVEEKSADLFRQPVRLTGSRVDVSPSIGLDEALRRVPDILRRGGDLR